MLRRVGNQVRRRSSSIGFFLSRDWYSHGTLTTIHQLPLCCPFVVGASSPSLSDDHEIRGQQIRWFSSSRGDQKSSAQSALNQLSADLTELERLAKSSSLDHLVPVWEQHDPENNKQSRQELLTKTLSVMDKLQEYLQKNILRPKAKHHHEFSVLIELLLQSFSYCASSSTSIWQQCAALLELLEQYNTSISHTHCEYIVHILAREGRWSEAATVYTQHVDPEQDGFMPVLRSNKIPDPTTTGLYCVARAAQNARALPVENCFDTVLKLTMVSPNDKDYYVLAAGVALGRAGEWEALRSYLQSSYKAKDFGQSLAAAAMHACVLNNRHEEAWAIFEELNDGELAVASEWQWDGSENQLYPACRDLAMRALIGVNGDPAALRDRAVELYQKSQELNCKVSIEALCGVARACGVNGNWEDVIGLFLQALDKPPESWLVLSDDLLLIVEETVYTREVLVAELGSFVDQVMQYCNESKRFGLGLCLLRLYEVTLLCPALDRLFHTNITKDLSKVAKSIVPVIRAARNTDDLAKTVAVALCGVNAPDRALEILQATVPQAGAEPLEEKEFELATYVKYLEASSDASSFNSWDALHRHTHRITASLVAIENSEEILNEEDQQMLSFALGRAIRECVALGEPETAITLGRWVHRRRLPIKNDHENIALFTFREDQSPFPLPLTDSLLSASLEAYVKICDYEAAQQLIQSTLGEQRPPQDWLLSYTEALNAWFALGQAEDAISWFRAVLSTAKSPALFSTAAKHMKAAGNWRDVLDIYHQAHSSGCASEEVGLFAMESVAARGRIGEKSGQLPKLRSIIISTSQVVGTTPSEWVEANYWNLKRTLGPSNSRLIMGWNDVKTWRLDELEFVLESFEKRSAAGLTPKRNVCFALVKAASEFAELQIPFEKNGLPKLPRDEEGWKKILDVMLRELEGTPLIWEARFIDKAAAACFNLGLFDKCMELVSDGLSRGLRISKKALQCSASAAKTINVEHLVANERMLLIDPPEWETPSES